MTNKKTNETKLSSRVLINNSGRISRRISPRDEMIFNFSASNENGWKNFGKSTTSELHLCYRKPSFPFPRVLLKNLTKINK